MWVLLILLEVLLLLFVVVFCFGLLLFPEGGGITVYSQRTVLFSLSLSLSLSLSPLSLLSFALI